MRNILPCADGTRKRSGPCKGPAGTLKTGYCGKDESSKRTFEHEPVDAPWERSYRAETYFSNKNGEPFRFPVGAPRARINGEFDPGSG